MCQNSDHVTRCSCHPRDIVIVSRWSETRLAVWWRHTAPNEPVIWRCNRIVSDATNYPRSSPSFYLLSLALALLPLRVDMAVSPLVRLVVLITVPCCREQQEQDQRARLVDACPPPGTDPTDIGAAGDTGRHSSSAVIAKTNNQFARENWTPNALRPAAAARCADDSPAFESCDSGLDIAINSLLDTSYSSPSLISRPK